MVDTTFVFWFLMTFSFWFFCFVYVDTTITTKKSWVRCSICHMSISGSTITTRWCNEWTHLYYVIDLPVGRQTKYEPLLSQKNALIQGFIKNGVNMSEASDLHFFARQMMNDARVINFFRCSLWYLVNYEVALIFDVTHLYLSEISNGGLSKIW